MIATRICCCIRDHLLKTDAVRTKAVVIDQKNYAPNDPVKSAWSYSYLFMVDGKKYSNNAHDPTLKIGDSVDVEYVKGNPDLNRPVHPNE